MTGVWFGLGGIKTNGRRVIVVGSEGIKGDSGVVVEELGLGG